MARANKHGRDSAEVLALQMEAFYGATPIAILSILGALIAVYVYWAQDTRFGLTIWFACVGGLALARLLAAQLRHRGRPARWTQDVWARLATVIYLGAGLSWGIGGAWMLGHGNEHQAVVICCLAMGAVMVTFPTVVYPPAYNAFQISIFSTFAFGLGTSDLQFGAVLSIASVLLCVFTTIVSGRMGAQLILALRLSDENRKLVEELEQRSAALEVANRELEIQSLTDPLTGVANRRQLMSFVRAAPMCCAVAVVDVDYFKEYNDSFGHVSGDVCLTLIAETLQRSIRRGVDLVARHGGEEFSVVLVNVTEREASLAAEQIRLNVQWLAREHPQAIRRVVTVSIGLAHRSPDHAKTVADLMEEADVAVYEAKRRGRNRVCVPADTREAVTANVARTPGW